MTIFHAVVWLDHNEARVCFLHEDGAAFDEQRVVAHEHHSHHHREGHHQNKQTDRYYQSVAQALESVKEILVVGPSHAPNEFCAYLQTHQPKLRERVLGVESADHPTSGQLAAQGRAFFKRADAMLHGPHAAGPR